MKRNVQKMSEEMKREITKIEGTFKPFEHHVYTVLENSIIGPTTSLYQHLDYRYSLRKSQALVDHDHCEESFCQERVDCNQTKITCDQALFSFRSVKHSGGTGETKNRA